MNPFYTSLYAKLIWSKSTLFKLMISFSLVFFSVACFAQATTITTVSPSQLVVGTPTIVTVSNSSGTLYVTDPSNIDVATTALGTQYTFTPTASGTYTFTYRKKSTGEVLATASASTTAVTTLTDITFNPTLTIFCSNGAASTINGAVGTPAGGTMTYSGLGVTGSSFNPITTGVGTYEIKATYTTSTGIASATASFSVISAPIVKSLYAIAPTYCVGSAGTSLFLADPETGVTYTLYKDGSSTGLNGTTTASLVTWNNVTAGTYSVAASNSTTGCSIAPFGSVTIQQAARPTATISGGTTICTGTSVPLSVNLTGTAPFAFTYTANGVTPLSVSTYSLPNTVYVSPLVTSEYKITSLSDKNCSATVGDIIGSTTVIVNTRPTAVISGTKTLCKDESTNVQINFTGSAPWAITYSDGVTIKTVTGITSNPYTFLVTPTKSTTYSIGSVTDANGCTGTFSGSAVITVNDLPDVNAGLPQSICSGDSYTLHAEGAKTYKWDNGPALSDWTVSPTTTVIYKVTGTSDYGCVNTDTVSIMVRPRPSANAGSGIPLCKGSSTTLTASGGTKYYWNTTGANTPSIVVTPLKTTSYVVTVTNSDNCSSQATVLVTVNDNPTVTLGSDLYMCHGDTKVLTATAGAGNTGVAVPSFTYLWSTGQVSPSITVKPTNTTTLPVVYSYSVKALDGNLCAAYDTLNLTVNPLPTVSILNLEASYCKDNGAVELVGVPSTVNGIHGTFTISANGTIADHANGTATFTPSAQTPGSYYDIVYTYTNGNGCKNTVLRTVYIRNEVAPVVTISNIAPLFCDDDASSYPVLGTPKPNNPDHTGVFSGNVIDNGNGSAYFIPKNLGVGNFGATYTYTDYYHVSATNPVEGQCSASASDNFTVGLPIVINRFDSCANAGSVLLSVTKPADAKNGTFTVAKYNGTTYIDQYSGDEGVARFDPSVIGEGTYKISYTTSSSTIACTGSASTIVNVRKLPSSTFTVKGIMNTDPNIDICYNGGSATLLGNPTLGGKFSGIGVSGNTFNPVVAGVGTNRIITHTYTDAYGCTTTSNANVEVLLVPKAVINLPVPSTSRPDSVFCHSDGAVTFIGDPLIGNGTYGVWAPPTSWTSAMFKDNGNGTATFYPSNTPVGLNTYTIGYNVTQQTGCVSSATKHILVNYLPTVDFSSVPFLPTDICINGSPILLTGSPLPIAGKSTGVFSGNGITNNGNGTATFNPSGLAIIGQDITYTYTDLITGCQDSKTHTVTIKQKPALFTVTGGGIYCANSNANIVGLSDSETGTTYTLKLNTSTKTSLPGTGAALDFGSQTASGTYTVTAVNAPNGCSETMSGSAVLVVTPLPDGVTSTITGANVNVCPGKSYTYSITPLANADYYEWTLPAKATITSDATKNSITVLYDLTIPQGIIPAASGLKVRGVNTCGKGPLYEVPITVSPLPSALGKISGDIKVCQGATLKAYSVAAVTTADSYEWTLPTGMDVVSGDKTKDVILNFTATAASGTISVAGVNACGTGDTSSLRITVVPTPNVSIDPPTSVINCKPGSTVTLNAKTTTLGTSKYSWAPSLGGSIVSGGTSATPIIDKAGTYTVTLTEPVNSCTVQSSVTVSSDYNAPADPSVSADFMEINCFHPQVTLTASTTSAYTPSCVWTTGTGHIVSGGTSPTPIVDEAGTYIVTMTNTATGCSGTAQITISKYVDKPDFEPHTPAELTCTNATVKVDGTATSPSLYSWTGPIGATISDATLPDPSVNMPGVYTVRATSKANNCYNEKQITVIQNLAKSTSININAPSTIITCSTKTIDLTPSAIPVNSTYTWTTTTGGGITSTTPSGIATISAAGDYTVTVTHPTTGCTDTKTISIIRDITEIDIQFPTTPPAITCTATTSLISPTLAPATTLIVWTGPGVASSPTQPSVTVNKPGTYSITATNSATGCPATRTVTVADGRIYPKTPGISVPSKVSCTNPTITLIGSTNLLNNYSKLWTATNGGVIVGPINDINAVVRRKGTYTLTITNDLSGCSLSGSAVVDQDTVAPDINVTPLLKKLTCTNLQVELSSSSSTVPTPAYKWTGPATSIIVGDQSPTPKVDLDGVYTLTLTGSANGCVSTRTVTVQKDITPPATPQIISPLDLTCLKKTTDLEVSPQLSDVTYLWTGPGNITNGTIYKANVDAIGTYKVVATSTLNGCTSENTVIVDKPITPLTVTIAPSPTVITCTLPTLTFNAISPDGENPTWAATLGGHVVSGGNSNSVVVNASGTYTVTYTHKVTSCPESASVVVTSAPDKPKFDVNYYPGNLTCDKPRLTLSSTITEPNPYTFTWTTSDGNFYSGQNSLTPEVDKAGNYILELTITATGCKDSKTVVVADKRATINLSPSVPAKITCYTPEIPLMVTPTNASNPVYSWTTSGTGSIKGGTAGIPSAVAKTPGIYVVRVTDGDTKCYADASIEVFRDTVSPKVYFDPVVDKLNCVVKEITLKGNSSTVGADYLWTRISGSGSIANNTSLSARVNASGIYRLTATSPTPLKGGNGCSGYKDITVAPEDTISPNISIQEPLPLTALHPKTIIVGGSSTAVDYTWTGPGIISDENIPEITVNKDGKYTLTVTDQNNRCTSSLSKTVILENNRLNPPAATGATICVGSSPVTLTATGTSLKWYSDATLASKIADGSAFTPPASLAPGNYTYYVTQTDGTSFVESFSTPVLYTVRALPFAPDGIPNAICQGLANTAIKAIATGSDTIKWYNKAGGTLLAVATSYTPPSSISLAGSYPYYATQTDANGCQSAAKEVIFKINPRPNKPDIDPISSTLSICKDETPLTFNASGNNVKWYSNAALTVPITTLTPNAFKMSETAVGTYTYFATETSSDGCVSDYKTVTYTVKPRPAIFNVTGGGSYCDGQSGAEIKMFNSEVNTTYQLLLKGSTLIKSMQGTGSSFSFGTNKAEGKYTVIATNNKGCSSTMGSYAEVIMSPLPSLASPIKGDITVCQGETGVTYSIEPVTNADSYVWTVPLGATIKGDSTKNIITLDFDVNATSGPVILTAVGKNTCGLGGANITTINVVANPQLTVNQFPDLITCKNPHTTVSATSSTGSIFSWAWDASGGGSIDGATNGSTATVNNDGTYKVTITESVNHCTASGSVVVAKNITAYPSFTIASGVGNTLTCTNPKTTLTAPSDNAYTYSWVGSDGGIVSGANSPTPSVNKKGRYTVTMKNKVSECTTLSSFDIINVDTLAPYINLEAKTSSQLNCANPVVELNGYTSPATTYLWTGPFGATFAGGNNSPNPKVNLPGDYTLTAIGSNGCVASKKTTVVKVDSIPQNVKIDPPAKFTCSRKKVTLTASYSPSSASCKWSTSDGNIISALTDRSITITKTGTYKVTVTHPTTYCTKVEQITITDNDVDTIHPVIDIPSIPTAITCSNATSKIETTITPVGCSILWGGPGITSSRVLEDITVNAGGTYNVFVTDTANHCTSERTVLVASNNFTPKDSISITPPSVIRCNNPRVTLNGHTNLASNNYIALWTTSNGGVISGSKDGLDAIATTRGTYELTITNRATGCSNYTSKYVSDDIVEPLPSIDPDHANLNCEVQQVTLKSTNIPGVTYSWTGPALATIVDGQSPDAKVNLDGTYTLTVTSKANGCSNATSTVVIRDAKSPGKPVIITPDPLTCSKTTTLLKVSPPLTNVDYLWSTRGKGVITNAKTDSATVNATGTYKVLVTDRVSRCTEEDSVTVIEVKTLPTVSITKGTLQISCTVKSLQLEAKSADIKPTWTSPNGGHVASAANPLKPMVDAKGTYYVTVTNSVSGCTAKDSVEVSADTSIPVPDFDAYPATITCNNPTVTLMGKPKDATGVTFKWIASPGNFVRDTTTYNPVVNKKGTYLLELTKTANGCKSITAINVDDNIETLSIPNFAEPAKLSCLVKEVNLSTSITDKKYSHNWTTSGTGSIKPGTETSPTATALTAGIYTVKVTNIDNGCTSKSKSVTVGRNDTIPDNVYIYPPAQLNCLVKQIELKGDTKTKGATYLWTKLSGIGTITNSKSLSPTVNAPGKYRFTVTHPSSFCVASKDVEVVKNDTVPNIWVDTNPLPLNAIRPSTQIKGSSTTLGALYLWKGPVIIPDSTSKEPYVNAAGTYYLTVTSDKNHCTKDSSVTVSNNNTKPQAPAVTSNSVCVGSKATTLTATGNGIRWYSDPSLLETYLLSKENTYVPISYTLPGSYSFYVTQTDPINYYQSDATKVTYTVNALPAKPLAINDSVCQGSANTAIKATGDAGNYIRWYDKQGGTLLATSPSYTPPASVGSTRIYYATQTDNNGCQSDASEVKFIVNPLLLLNIDPNIKKLTCINTEVTLNGSANVATALLHWTGPGVVTDKDPQNTLVNKPGTYTLSGINTKTGCASAYNPTIDVIPDIVKPKVSFPTVPNVITCTSPSVNITGSSTIADISKADWQWSNTTGLVFVSGARSQTVTVSDSGVYKLSVTNIDNGCVGTDTIHIKANQNKPIPHIDPVSPITCDQAMVTLNGKSTPGIPDVSVLWTVANGGVMPVGSETSLQPSVSKEGTYIMTVTKVDNGCKASKSVYVKDESKDTLAYFPHITINATPGYLNCKNTKVQLYGNAPNATLLWTGPGNITNPTSPEPFVDMVGTYTVEATNIVGGCKSTKTIVVKSNKVDVKPTIDPALTITCKIPTVQLNVQSGLSGGAAVAWTAISSGNITSSSTIKTITVDKEGVYKVVVTDSASYCTGSATVNVIDQQADAFLPKIAFPLIPSPISCKSISTVLNSTVSSSTGAEINLVWTGPTGANFSDARINNPTVYKDGKYTLTATDTLTGCKASGVLSVEPDTEIPDIYIDPTSTISCKATALTAALTASIKNNVSYSAALWSTTDGAISGSTNSLNAKASTKGHYTITITNDANGCKASKSVQVYDDIIAPGIQVDSIPAKKITCGNKLVELNGNTLTNGATLKWTGTGIVTADYISNPKVNSPGIFTLTVTDTNNGCTKTGKVTVERDIVDPSKPVIIPPGSLTCDTTEVKLNVLNPLSDNSYSWTSVGLNSITDDKSPNAIVYKSGTYIVTATKNANGCTNSDTIFVSKKTAIPDISIGPGPYDVNCNNPTVTITSSSTTGISPVWVASEGGNIKSGPKSFNPIVNAGGVYTLTLKHPATGCKKDSSIRVNASGLPIIGKNFSWNPDTLTCDIPEVTLFGEPEDITNDFGWSAIPGSFSADKNNSPKVTKPGTYTLTITNAKTGCQNHASVVVAQSIDKPVVKIISPDSITCTTKEISIRSSVNITNPSYLWTTSGTGIIKPNYETQPVTKVLAVGTYYLTVKNKATGCISDIKSVEVFSKDQKPDNQIYKNPAKITCAKNPVILSAKSIPGASFVWTSKTGATILNSNSLHPSVSAAGYYYLTVTDTITGCFKVDSVEVKNDTIVPNIWANPKPDLLNCIRHKVTLSGSSTIPNPTYLWTGPGGFSEGGPDVSATQKGIYTLTVTNTSNSCTATRQVIVIEDITPPPPPLVVDASNCIQALNDSLKAKGTLVKWYSNALLSNNDLQAQGSSFMPSVKLPHTYTYFATQTDPSNGCESKPTTAIYTIKPRSDRPSVDAVSICKGQITSSLVANGEDVKWYDAPNGTLLASGNTYNTGKISSGTYLFYATQTQSAVGCESETVTVQLTIHDLPSTPVLNYTTLEVCKGLPIQNLSATGADVKWYADSDLAVSIHSGSTYAPNLTSAGLFNFYATQTSLFGCVSPSAKATIKINENPKQFIVGGGGSYCQGSDGLDVTLSQSEVGVTYQLLLNGAFTTAISKVGTGSSLNFGKQKQSGVYSVLGVTPDNCSIKMSGGVAVVMNPLPETGNGIKGATYICQGKTESFIADSIGNATTYEWTLPAGATIISGVNSRTITVGFNNDASTGTMTVRGVNTCGYGISSAGKTIVVNPNPKTVGKITGPSLICEGDNMLTFQTDEIENATSYEWTLPAGVVIMEGKGTRQILVDFSKNDAGGTFTVRGVNDCGKGPVSDPFVVSIKKKPVANAGYDDDVCGSITTLAATNPVVGATGEWSVAVGPGIIINTVTPVTQVKNLMMGKNKFVWKVTLNGCTSVDTIQITNNKVIVDAGPDQVLCSKETKLDARAPLVGGQWSIITGKAGIYNPSSPTSDVSSLDQGENKLTWFVYNGSCLSSDTVMLINNRPLTPNAGIRQLVKNNFTQLGAKEPEIGTIGTWSVLSGAGSFADKHLPTTTITGLNPGVNLLQWTVTRNGCNLIDTVTIEFEKYEIADAGPDQNICTNYTTLRANEPQSGIGRWSVIEGTAIFENSKLYNTKVTGLGYDRNLLKWEIRRSGSTSVSDTVMIINNSVTTANAGRDQIICTDSAGISAGPAIYGTGAWTVISGAGFFGNALDNDTKITKLAQGDNVLKWAISKDKCYSESLITLTNNTPTKADAGIDVTTCEDSVVLAPNTATYGVGTWSVIDGSAIFKGNSASQLATNDNTLRWTIKKGTCSSTDDVVITSNKPSTADAGVNKPVCLDSITLGGNKPIVGKGIWTLQNGSATLSDSLYWQSKASNLGLGRNIFRWTISYKECKSADDVEITNGLIKANAGKDQEVCDDKYNLDANSAWPGKGTWSVIGNESAATFVDVNSPNSQVIKLEQGTNTLRWTIINGACVSFDEMKISNNLPSESYAGPDASVCDTWTILDANPVVVGTGKWEVLSGSGVIRDVTAFNSRIDSLGLGNNILRWSVTNKGCILSDEVKISNNEPVYVDAGKNQTLCADSTSLYANRPSIGTGQWAIISGSASFSNNTAYNSIITNLAKGVNILRWTVKSKECKVSDTVYITNNLPSKSMAGPDKVFCQDSSVLAANKPEYGKGEWWVINGGATLADKTKYNSKVTNLGFGENRFRWMITNKDCQLFDDVVLVNNSPSLPVVSSNHSTCADSTVLFASVPDVGVGSWSVVSGSGIIERPGDNQTRINKMGFGPNTFRWTILNKSCSLHGDVVVTNNLSEVNAGIDQIVFSPTSTIIGNNPIAGKGLWKLTAGAGAIEKPSSFSSVVTALGIGRNSFTWTIENNGCVASDMVDVTYYNMPIPDFIVNTDNGCPPLAIDFVNKSIGGSPYHWDFGDGEWSDQMNISHTFSNTGKYKVRMTGTAPGGFTVHKDTVITVHNVPKAKFEYTPSTVFIPGQHVSFFNTSQYADSFQWTFGDGKFASEKNPKYTYRDTGRFTVMLKAITNFGCTDSLVIENAVYAKDAGEMVLPSAFSPNPNGSSNGTYDPHDFTNDVFFPIVIKAGIETYNMKVFNRWGVQLFESNDINIGWDGYYKGKLMAQDVYIYIVTGTYNNGEKFNKVGDIMLIRKQ